MIMMKLKMNGRKFFALALAFSALSYMRVASAQTLTPPKGTKSYALKGTPLTIYYPTSWKVELKPKEQQVIFTGKDNLDMSVIYRQGMDAKTLKTAYLQVMQNIFSEVTTRNEQSLDTGLWTEIDLVAQSGDSNFVRKCLVRSFDKKGIGYLAQFCANQDIYADVRNAGAELLSAMKVVLPLPRPGAQKIQVPYIKRATMSTGLKNETNAPVGERFVFAGSTSVFHSVLSLNNAPKNTNFRAEWYVVDVGTVAPPDTLIVKNEVMTDGTRFLAFTLTPNDGRFPPGVYRVEIFANNQPAVTMVFSVGK
jgi:hypothetical protein